MSTTPIPKGAVEAARKEVRDENELFEDERNAPMGVHTYQFALQFAKEQNAELKAFCLKQHQMLRAFRYSMDTNKPFPSMEKLDQLITTHNEIYDL